MTFPHPLETLRSTFGYHPLVEDINGLVSSTNASRLLVFGPDVPDVLDDVAKVHFIASPPAQLPRGIYWFASEDDVEILYVSEGSQPAHGAILAINQIHQGDELANAHGWFKSAWDQSFAIPFPEFAIRDDVVVRATGEETYVRGRRFSTGKWLYELRLSGRAQTISEDQLTVPPKDNDASLWIREEPSPVERFAATLTRAKLQGTFTDTVFSFRATKTIFRPYQFKPVMKFLQTGKSRILIADEVGLGKTIEAGLIWTELEARRSANHVLVVTPSNLVAKWRREMEERFNFNLIELSGSAIKDFEERAQSGRLPRRAAYIGSLERLRRWEELQNLSSLIPMFDLVIFDEAHALRNLGTRSNAFGGLMSEMAENLVFLSATPINLRSQDLFNLLDLLSPGEYSDPTALEEQLQPNGVLHKIGESLSRETWTAQERLNAFKGLKDLKFGAALLKRPEADLLRELLELPLLNTREVVKAKQYLSDLNTLSTSITRTRKVDVDEKKALREPRYQIIDWTQQEISFYDEYFKWCVARADAAGTPVYFSMQMPIRLASACLPAARDQVLAWNTTPDPIDEDEESTTTSSSSRVPPHPELLAAARNLGETDTKLERLIPLVSELRQAGKQVLLFTFSKPTLAYLKSRLEPYAKVAVMHGDVPKETRRTIMADFRNGAYDILLANRVASEGLDFEFCSVVINYDLPWNPMEIEQRIGRIDRIGQTEEKIVIVNFRNDYTIDEKIITKVLDRINVFEQSIGALEPIVYSHLAELQRAIYDFSLSDAQREAKAAQVLQAVEAQTQGLEDLSTASSYLLASSDLDVKGMEDELLRTGRYVGQVELRHLIDDWCQITGARGTIQNSPSSLTVRGNTKMADQVRGLVAKHQRTSSEVQDMITLLQAEMDIHLSLDQEVARRGEDSLLTSNHPLVLAALSVPGYTNSRFTRAKITMTPDLAPAGVFLVQLAVAEWGGIRPGREIWGAVANKHGQEASSAVADALLSQLATGGLEPGESHFTLAQLDELVIRTTQFLDRRQVQEADEKEREARALLESRRLSLESLHERKLASIEEKINTAKERARHRAIPLFEAQRRRAEERHFQQMETLAQGTYVGLQVNPLAVCELEIVNG